MLKAGTVITCPECETQQIKSTKDLQDGSQMKDAGWVSLGFDLKSQRAGCYRCSTKFVRQHPLSKRTQIHTSDNGWISLSKKEPPKSEK